MKRFGLIFLLFSIFTVFFLSSCSNKKDEVVRIEIKENLTWALTSLNRTPEETDKLNFKHLERLGFHNLVDVAGNDGKFIWIKAEFTIPEELKNQDLGLFASYIHFADKVWINGCFAGEYGRFPPEELSAQYISHFYPFPKTVLNQDGVNTILMKVYCLGRAEISNNIFVGSYEDAKSTERKSSFWLTIFYMQFEGGMFAAFLIYILMYFIEKRKHNEYLFFALSCFFTLQFALMFFAPLSPVYTDSSISFLFIYKYLMCFCFYVGAHFLELFMMQYLNVRIPTWRHVLRGILLGIMTVATFIAPSYYVLMKFAPYISVLCMGILFLNIGIVIASLFNRRKRYKASILLIGLTPLMLGALVDVIIHYFLGKTDMPFFMYIGWQASIISYLVVLCVRFTRASMENLYLNQSLREEVESQTNKLKIASKALESELGRARTDMQMASIVQQKTFEHYTQNFIGWDIGLSYKPLSEVSGDMYDFYNIGFNLTGFSLFDVSGHGIAASLITMLSKNIIYQAFKNNQMENRTSGDLLLKINDEISRSKGNAENYLTGLIFQIDAFIGDTCSIEFANAGHPHPFLFSKKDNSASNLIPEDTQNQYGAIGIQDMEVSFQDIRFTMETGDILVCFTDGITEIQNKEGLQFGREALKQIIEDNNQLSAQELVDLIISSIDEFAEDNPREDDITILVLKRERPDDFIEEL